MLHSVIVIDEQYSGISPVNFGYEDCAPSHCFGPAVREYWLLHYVVSGRGRFLREGTEHVLTPGEVFVIPPHLETYYEADAADPWQYIWVGFTVEEALTEVFAPPVLRTPGMGAIFAEMRRCAEYENGRSAFLAARVWDLISLLLDAKRHEPDYVEKAIHCMRAEYMQDLNVAKLAARLNLDRAYFSTLFKARTGVSPGRYLTDLRLTKAAELMTSGGQSPSTAAASVGYPDLYHFSKAFKQKFSISPRAYQKRHS